jgi:hypothetical protein
MAIEHHQCFHIYIVKTRATRVSNKVFFKHQYVTNPQVTPKTLAIKAASELTGALKGLVSCNGKTAEALERFSELFTKIATAKAAIAKAKEQQNNLQTHPMLTKQTHFQGWLTDHLSRQAHFQGCQLLPRRLILA